ncbi:MAG: heme ABC exporter ATP-binding protein CcmA, partial [Acidimicrobiia bacterium]
PHAGLDAAGRAVVDAVISAAPGEGRSVVLASHELGRARGLAQREVVLSAGRIATGVVEPELAPT